MSLDIIGESGDFHESIVLDKEMTPAEAIRDLQMFYDLDRSSILFHFPKLEGFFDGKVKFIQRQIGGGVYVVMEGIESGGRVWNYEIDAFTGRKRQKVA